MSIIVCCDCTRFIDTDFHADDVTTIELNGTEADICIDCADKRTEREQSHA